MRPAVVCHSETLGGAEIYLNRLYEGLRADGDDPVLLGTLPGWSEKSLGAVPVSLGPKWSKRTIVTGVCTLPLERRRVCRAAGQVGAEVFHLQFKREQIGFTRSLAKMAPVVWTEHGQFLGGAAGSLLAVAYRAAARHVACIICVSSAVATDVRAVVGPDVRLVVIENAVMEDGAGPTTASGRMQARADLGIDSKGPVALWIGRAHPAKRPELAVRLASEFDGTVIIAGDGPERLRLERMAEGVDNVRVLGHVESTRPLFDAADFMFFTSAPEAREGLPTTLVEAASHELPVLALDDSGLDDLLHGLGAVSVPVSQSPAEWIARSRALYDDPAPFRVAARRWTSEHSGKEWLARHRKVLESAAAGTGNSLEERLR